MLRKNAKFSKATISVKGFVSRWELRVGIHKATYNRYYNTVSYTKQDREVSCELCLENNCSIILRSFLNATIPLRLFVPLPLQELFSHPNNLLDFLKNCKIFNFSFNSVKV